LLKSSSKCGGGCSKLQFWRGKCWEKYPTSKINAVVPPLLKSMLCWDFTWQHWIGRRGVGVTTTFLQD
jgi:hypothetical protein